MRKHYLAASIAAVALIPSLAMAQQTCEQRSSNRTAGTAIGAVAGALLGSAVAGHGEKGTGAVVGGVGGAIIGNQLSKGQKDCQHAYGYYDSNSQWHANSVARNEATGYYDREGRWVDGAPRGYYDRQGRWVSTTTTASAAGYYDSDGHWIPSSANGYYETNGEYVAGTTAGHYENGRWVAGYGTGHYDRDGRWVSGDAGGHRDANGVWVADAQPGYYDNNGRWRAGTVAGYYDAEGRWVGAAPSAGNYTANASYESRPHTMDIDARIVRIDQRIQEGRNDGTLSRSEARRALTSLNDVRRQERYRARNGYLRDSDQAMLNSRLDQIAQRIRMDRSNY
jgi:hypothetical protein